MIVKKYNNKNKFSNSISNLSLFLKKIPLFLKTTVLINICLLIAFLIFSLVSLLLFPSNDDGNTNKLLNFNFPKWLVVIVTFLGSIFNLISVLLMTYKKKSSFIWGIFAVVFLGLNPFVNALWGNVIIYWCYYVFTQIIMYFWWSKKIKDDKTIITKHIKWWEFAIILTLLLGLTIGITIIETQIPPIAELFSVKNNTSRHQFVLFLDSFILCFTLSVVYFVARRYIERWIISLCVNSAQIIMWCFIIILGIVEHANWLNIISSAITLLTVTTMFAITFNSLIIWSKKTNEKR